MSYRDRPRGPPPSINGLHSLKVDNISYQTTQHELRRMFERYGDIGDVHIPRDRHTRQSRGFGFVRFVSRKDADYAISKMDGRYIDGREIRVSFAKYDRPIDESGRERGDRRDRGSDERRRSRSRSPVRRRSRSESPPQRSPSRSRSRSPITKGSASRSRSP
uniref:RRM domain-containing protein n=1 Tax=Panagrolaimus sp. JU765 TaxID=591449 RepID=A0AC34PXC3_9BILA